MNITRMNKLINSNIAYATMKKKTIFDYVYYITMMDSLFTVRVF